MRRALTITLALLCGCPPPNEPGPGPQPAEKCTASPSRVDFGEVESAGGIASAQITLSNPTDRDRKLQLSELDPPFLLDARPGEFQLQAHSTRAVRVRFEPRDALLHLGELRLTADGEPDATCELSVPIRGLGSGQPFFEPGALDFGSVDPGEEATLELRVENPRRGPVTIDELSVLTTRGEPGSLSLTPSPVGLVVPARGSLVFTATAAPRTVGVFAGTISLLTNTFTPDFNALTASWAFTSGKAVAEVLPVNLTWLTGFDEGSQPPSFSSRAIRIRNVGTSGNSRELGLKLGTPGVVVQALQGSIDEIQVSAPLELSRSGLLEGESAELDVTLQPSSLGPKEFRVIIFTNAPDGVPHEVRVQATAQTFPSCDLLVNPFVSMRLVGSADGGSAGTVRFTNAGMQRCVLDDVRLAKGSDPRFSIVAGETSQLEVPPGGVHLVTVAGPPLSGSPLSAALQFHVFNRNSTVQLIQIYAAP